MTELNVFGDFSDFWDYFKKISKIPHCSGNEEGIRNYIIVEVEKLGFKSVVDDVGNIVVKVPSESNGGKKIVLQCHMDMVCEKNEKIIHDFALDPLKLKIIEINNEKWLTAEGTTLGADNGVGISYFLTLMKRIYNGDINFEKLELYLLFTVDEEKGLRGAFEIDEDLIDGNYLINLDSEDDDKFTVGCAGGINTTGEFKIIHENVNNYIEEAIPVKISIKGLIGGHSGVDIHRGRANAVKIIAEILWKINTKFSMQINSINGGNLSNAIPRESQSIFFINKTQFSKLIDFIEQTISEIKLIFSEIEPSMQILFEKINNFDGKNIWSEKVKEKLLHILYVIPNGPLSYHAKNHKLVHTSSNLASIKTTDDLIKILTSQRSLEEISKKAIYEKIGALFKLADMDVNLQHVGDYPGWEPNFNSKLLSVSKETYIELFNDNPEIEVIHAGLECGILKKKFPDMEMISIGPTMVGPHSPEERLNINSVKKVWNFLIKLINNLI